jgi:O-antigen/teichoic acid export membrane protein
MLSRNTTLTIITKFIILLANFGLVVFTTQIWGSEGRGEIALVIASISIITIFSNVFCGSTLAYHAPKLQKEFLFSLSFIAALIISFSGAIVFSVFFGSNGFIPLFLISLLISLTTAISTYWLGKNNIRNYNLLTLLNPVLILISLTILYFIFKKTTLNTVYQSYYIGTGMVVIIGMAGLAIREAFKAPEISFSGIKNIFTYGINNEFSYLIQFLNYRLSYYFIAEMLGLSDLGVFSVVVSVSEAVWIISRSMSAVHFSNVINSDDHIKSRHETISFAKQSLIISLLLLAVAVLIPGSLYQAIFGNEFGGTRQYILYLIPGITAIAVSNLFGHYFAGTGKLVILRNKSLIGLGATLILLPILIRKYQLTGVCISLNISYILSSLYLWIHFRKAAKAENLNISG